MSQVRAIYKGKVIAESKNTIEVEGNHYFPKADVNFEYLTETGTSTLCPWKGDASYFSVNVEDDVAIDGCWYYPEPSDEARKLKNHFAFWGDVNVVKETSDERLGSICKSTVSFMRGIVENTKGAQNRCPGVVDEVKTFLNNLGEESLTYSLPVDYINNISFFNYYNSTNACFHADHEQKIIKTNPTFNWAFDHLGSALGNTLESFLDNLEILEISKEEIFKTLKSHGWVKVPRIRLKKNEDIYYYSLDVAITKHGDLDCLTGIQGQFIDVTKEVELSQSVEDLLNNAGEGFLSFCSSYKVQEKYSRACANIFGQEIASKDILELLFPLEEDKSKRESQKDTLDLIFSELTEFDILREVFVNEVYVNEKWLKIDYRWIPKSESNSENRMMLIISDITKEKDLESKLEEDEARQEAILKVVSDRDGYIDMQLEVKAIFSQADEELNKDLKDIDSNALFRFFHTIKGGSAVYSFKHIVEVAHELENDLEPVRSGEVTLTSEHLNILKEEASKLRNTFEESIQEMNKLLGINNSEEKKYNVTHSKMDKMIEDLKLNIPREYLEHIDKFESKVKKEEIGPVLHKYKNTMLNLAETLGKNIDVVIEGEDIEVDKERLGPLFNGLIHLVRNSVDHGIEDNEMRSMSGKNKNGQIRVKAHDDKMDLVLTFEDDGGGVDADAVKRSALEKGIINQSWIDEASEQDIVKLIFHPGFSTKQEITDVSGRGVGMDAVKVCVEELDGVVDIDSRLGEGTTFTIRIPIVA